MVTIHPLKSNAFIESTLLQPGTAALRNCIVTASGRFGGRTVWENDCSVNLRTMKWRLVRGLSCAEDAAWAGIRFRPAARFGIVPA